MAKKAAFDLASLQHKRWLSPAEAVALGYFRSVKAAANRRYRLQQPPFSQEDGGCRVVYDRFALDEWMKSLRYDPQD